MAYIMRTCHQRRPYGTATTRMRPHDRGDASKIQDSKESIAALARRYDLNSKTVSKWKKRRFVHDAPMSPKHPRSTVLSEKEEALIVAFRQHTLLPLDDCLYALQVTIPHLKDLLYIVVCSDTT